MSDQMTLGGMPPAASWRTSDVIELHQGGSVRLTNTLVTTPEALARMVKVLTASRRFAWDTETSGTKPSLGARIIGHATGTQHADRLFESFYVPIRHINDRSVEQLNPDVVTQAMKDVLATEGQVVLHHAKFDKAMARADGIWTIRRETHDTSIRAVIHNENEHSFSLKGLAEKYVDRGSKADRDVLTKTLQTDARKLGLPYKKRRPGQEFIAAPVTYLEKYGYSRAPIHMLGLYACRDVFYPLALFPLQEEQVSLYRPLYQRENEVSEALLDMEWYGLPADPQAIRTAQDLAEQERDYWLTQIRLILHTPSFEPTPEALKDLFYSHLAMTVPKQTKSDEGDSTDKEARGLLAAAYPEHRLLIKTIDAYTKIKTIAGTYGAAFLRYYSSSTGCIHPSYNQLEDRSEGGVPVTGRLSSAEPNAQNVAKKPIHLRTCGCDACVKDWRAGKLIGPERVPGAEHALSIRRYFTVRPGYARIFIDLSQIELRILAWYSRDRLLLDAYANDRDIHAITAEEVTSGDRDIAKQVNFGNSYGMTEIGLAKRMAGYYEDPHGTRLRAKVVLAKFFATYEGIPVFRKNLANHMRLNNGMFVSVMGRPRRIEEILAREEWVRERGERMMMSSAISGTAADINKEIMIRNRRYLAQRFPSDQHVGLRQTVHDECMYDVPLKDVSETARGLLHYTKHWPTFADHGVPIDAGAAISVTTWENAKKLKIKPDGSVSL